MLIVAELQQCVRDFLSLEPQIQQLTQRYKMFDYLQFQLKREE